MDIECQVSDNMTMNAKIKTAVLPIAGKGTRLMPLTAHQPKAMINIADKPMIHYMVDEGLSTGIKHIIFVIAPDQKVFKDYLNSVKQSGEWKKEIPEFDFVIQKIPKGNGEALLSAKRFLKKGESFLVAFADDMIPVKESPIQNLIKISQKHNGPIVTLERVPKKLLSKYGLVKISSEQDNVYRIEDIVEKPKPKDAPSNLGAIGRYVLPYSIFKYLQIIADCLKTGDKEVYLTDAIRLSLKNGGKTLGWLFEGIKFDAGSKTGLLEAQAYFSAHHKGLKNLGL